ncbi:PEP-CTERM sorting domain-containing protein [Crateriforma conspicua]|uniref:Ice-binding protein C-terminal domain-containing protein n=1 Tax=Crateriforma conspicua TaxID=2527996 RepID=A0A5C5YA66_9PLAN|nr:PEP-CTERM sorting domain-containing protein [Crateriforma conspicua]QDV61726.1 hypothetical protein Mal65_08530 [Crateriforma conspicua]TWT72024.1 hypothetical protein Pan14r_43410 [Crateriforma conspicua]
MRIQTLLRAALGLLVVSLMFCHTAGAVPTRFLDEGAFNTEVSGSTVSVVDFDSVLADETISDGEIFDGLQFTYQMGLAADELRVVYGPTSQFGYDPVTAPGYLGNDTEELIGEGVSFTISRPGGFSAFSLQFLSPEMLLFPNDVQVRANGETFDFTDGAFSNEQVNPTGSGTGFKYFFGVTDSDTVFDSIEILTPDAPGASGYFGIDSIRYVSASAVPEPGSIALLGGLASVGAWRARRRRRRS